MPATPVIDCPECGCATLPPVDEGACPDCGFPYDRETMVWRPRRPWRIYIVFANTLIFSPWLFRFLAITLLWGSWPEQSVWIGALISAGSLCWALPRLRVLLSEGHRYAAVTPSGIYARTPKSRYEISWEEVKSVTVLLGVPCLHCYDRDRPVMLDWIFDSDREVRDFIDQINRARTAAEPS